MPPLLRVKKGDTVVNIPRPTRNPNATERAMILNPEPLLILNIEGLNASVHSATGIVPAISFRGNSCFLPLEEFEKIKQANARFKIGDLVKVQSETIKDLQERQERTITATPEMQIPPIRELKVISCNVCPFYGVYYSAIADNTNQYLFILDWFLSPLKVHVVINNPELLETLGITNNLFFEEGEYYVSTDNILTIHKNLIKSK